MKKLLFILFPLFLFGCGEVSQTNQNSSTLTGSEALSGTVQSKSFSMDEIKKHNKEDDCLTVINSLVYDLTNFTGTDERSKDKIIAFCGIDGSQLFNEQYAGKELTLKSFQVGVLK